MKERKGKLPRKVVEELVIKYVPGFTARQRQKVLDGYAHKGYIRYATHYNGMALSYWGDLKFQDLEKEIEQREQEYEEASS